MGEEQDAGTRGAVRGRPGCVTAKFTEIVRRRRKPDEIPSLRVAVRNHCLECCGHSAQEVALCTASKCWLWPWREGETPRELKRGGNVGSFRKQHGNSRAESPQDRAAAPRGTNGPARSGEGK